MDKNNGSRSQSYQSSGGSQQQSGNRGSGGQSGKSYENPKQVVREMCQDMAKGVAPHSYYGQRHLSERSYQKFMDGDYQ